MATATRSPGGFAAPSIVDDAVRTIVADLDAEAAFAGLADERGEVPLLHSCGVEPKRFAALTLRTGRGLGGRVLGESRAFSVADYPNAPSITRDYVGAINAEGLHGIACVPIPGENGVGGLLYVASRERGAPGDRLVDAVERVAAVTAARIRERVAHERERQRFLDHERRTMAGAVQDAVARQLLFIGQAARHAELTGDAALALRGIRRAADAAQRGLRDLWAPGERALTTLRVLLVDGHPMIRRGLRATVEDALGPAVIDEAATVEEALELARRAAPDLVLLDPRAPGDLPAAFACAELRALRPTTRVALVGSAASAAELRACLDAGACSCLRLDGDPLRLAEALRRTLDGEQVLDDAPDPTPVADDQPAGGPHLTPREHQVLTLLAEGCSNRQIAERLVLSEPTVKGHVGRLLAKLGARSRLQVVVRASELGLR